MRETFWDIACDYPLVWRLLLIIVIVQLMLLSMSFPLIERGTDSYYISIFSFAMLVPLLFASLYAIKRCSV